MNNKKISVVIITFLLLLNIAYIYSSTVIISNTITNNIKSSVSSKSDLINYSSFKQISRNVYDVCSKVYVTLQNDIYYFTVGIPKKSSLNKFYNVMYFGEKSVEYAFGGNKSLSFDAKSIFRYDKNYRTMPDGFNAIFVFVIAMFLLFLCALYRGSVPYSTIIINKAKTRYL